MSTIRSVPPPGYPPSLPPGYAPCNLEVSQNIIKFFDANLTFAGGIPRSKKVQNAILKKAPIVLDKEAELEKLAFQRVAKNIIKARENKHNGIRFFSKSWFYNLEKKWKLVILNKNQT